MSKQRVPRFLRNVNLPAGPKGDPGADGKDGVSVTGATSDGTNITFELSDGSTFDVPWPPQA